MCFAALCPRGWIKFEGSCYRNIADQKTWPNAERHCRILGGYLARISRGIEDDFVSQEIALPEYKVWIGLRRSDTGRSFVWSDNSNSTYSNWGLHEPRADDSGRNCVYLFSGETSLEWQTDFCSTRLAYVCERGK